jgi:hypothetical protein
MERKMEKTTDNHLLKFCVEVILQVLKLTDNKIKQLREIGDLSGAEILEKDIIEKYEKLYGGLTGEGIKEFKEEELKGIREHIENIMIKNNLSKEYIESQVALREKLKGDSGAEVIKRFFQYEKKELEKTKYDLLEKVSKVLDEEERVSMLMKNAIQEEEQIEYIYQLQPIREKYRELESKIFKVQDKLDLLKKKLDLEWYYEIYGTVSKDEMLKTYNEVMKKD